MSEFQKLIELQQAAIKEYESVKTAFQVRMKAEFEPIFKAFFEAFPEIEMIAWTQYTPYFNDVGACVFGVNDKDFVAEGQVNDEDGDPLPIYDYEGLEFPYKKPGDYVYKWAEEKKDPYCVEIIESYEKKKALYGARFGEICEGVAAMEAYLHSIPEEIYLAAFDDHVEVRVTKDGIDVSEYDHD